MRALVVLVTVFASAASQTSGCFWWIEGNCTNTDDTATPGTAVNPRDNTPTEDTENGSDGTRIVNIPPPSNVVESSYQKCNSGRGECVPYYLCKDGSVITDGAGLIDIRFGGKNGEKTRTSSSDCPSFLDVCCKAPESKPPPVPVYQPRCGKRNAGGINARILGFQDNQAQFGEFPWMAAVLRREKHSNDDVNLYMCGGSLIHPSIVLTAAHCVLGKSPTSLSVRLGEWDTQRTYELYPHQDRNVLTVEIHKGYNPNSLYYDFALLFLETPANLEANVDTICLPQPNQDFSYQKCWASGWGKDKFGKEGVYQNVLKKIQLDVKDHASCQKALRTTRLGFGFILHHSFVCAGGEPGQDTCKGDGGSPLVCESGLHNDAYVQVGIVAWGIGCGEGGVPGVYAYVPYVSLWIKETSDFVLQQLGRYTPNYWGF